MNIARLRFLSPFGVLSVVLLACAPEGADSAVDETSAAQSRDDELVSTQMAAAKKRVRLIATGGTIAGTAKAPNSPDYDAGTVTIDAILGAVPDVASRVTLEGSQLVDPGSVSSTNPSGYVNVPSPLIRERHWLALAKAVNTALENDGYDAVVVTHGTDTLEETAFFLQLTVNSPKPVVLVGAMRPAVGHSDPDGPDNIRTAVRVALDGSAAGRGVMIVQNFGIVPAYDAIKVQTYPPTEPVAHEQMPLPFDAPNYGLWGTVKKTGAAFDRWPVAWKKDHALSKEPRPLATKFDVTGVTALPKVPILYENVGNTNVELLEVVTKDPNVKSVVFAGPGNCSLTDDTRTFVKAQETTRPDLSFIRSAHVPKIWCKHGDQGFANSTGASTLSPQHAKILLQLLQSKAARSPEAATTLAAFRDHAKQFFATQVPYVPAAAPTP